MATESLSFTDRRLERRLDKNPDFDIEVWIRGVHVGDGMVLWSVNVEGEDDEDEAAGILERAAEVLRDKDGN